MEKKNHLNEMDIAQLSENQLDILQRAEQSMNAQQNNDEEVYVIALRRSSNQME